MEKLLDEKFPPGLDYEYEASLASHDPLDDVPECPPAAVEIKDKDDPISAVTSGFDVTASIACDAASVLPQEHVQEMFQDVFNQGVSPACSVPLLQLPPKLMRKLRSPNPTRININSLVVNFFSNLLATKTQILEQ